MKFLFSLFFPMGTFARAGKLLADNAKQRGRSQRSSACGESGLVSIVGAAAVQVRWFTAMASRLRAMPAGFNNQRYDKPLANRSGFSLT
ncbi:hypothetical protein A1507_06220 [Methylomonas koyamae]|uniref:Uncharacterized protein n=1 Tax=Methylomonas koyamae TaxID=702114 RepID=A0A177NPN3_9GAMM|nr:hypothetical protein A1507_06220 [Methylomonas koyamae]